MGTDYRSFRKEHVDRDVLDLARERTADAFDRFDTIVVSFSGGKDSTACLYLALEEAERRGRDIHIQFDDEEIMAPQTIAFVGRMKTYAEELLGKQRVHFAWYTLPFRYHNICSRLDPWWYPWDPAKRDLWIREKPEGAIDRHPAFDPGISWQDFAMACIDTRKLGTVGVIIGIRADESLIRTHAVTLRERDNWIVSNTSSLYMDGKRPWPGISKVYTVYDWTDGDVWTAPHKLGWDHNEAYDVMDQAGVARRLQRTGPPMAAESIVDIRNWVMCFPEIWDKLFKRIPGIRTACLYAETELYSFGERYLEPVEGQTWPERLEQELRKWDMSIRPLVVSKVKFYVDYHHRRTRNPIIDFPHPESGISWPFLVKVAVRGDLKERMRPQLEANRKKAQEHPERYEEALAAWLSKTNR